MRTGGIYIENGRIGTAKGKGREEVGEGERERWRDGEKKRAEFD